MASVKAKRKQWAPESMQEACKAVKDENMSLREAARKYSVPVETLLMVLLVLIAVLVHLPFPPVKRRLVWQNTVGAGF